MLREFAMLVSFRASWGWWVLFGGFFLYRVLIKAIPSFKEAKLEMDKAELELWGITASSYDHERERREKKL